MQLLTCSTESGKSTNTVRVYAMAVSLLYFSQVCNCIAVIFLWVYFGCDVGPYIRAGLNVALLL